DAAERPRIVNWTYRSAADGEAIVNRRDSSDVSAWSGMSVLACFARFAVASLAAISVSAHANDTAAELAIGGLKFARTANVAMESEQLNISLDQVRIRYQFRSSATEPVSLTVAFPLPDIDLSAGETLAFPSGDPANFVDFSTKIDGEAVKYTV